MKHIKQWIAILLLCSLCLLGGCAPRAPKVKHLPVLLYHHIIEKADGSSNVTASSFNKQMKMLDQMGYHPISLTQLIDFAEKGVALPENPVVITFDDGYYSNYQYAFPTLRQYNFPATIFAIGCSVGHRTFYKDTTHRLTPHFGATEIQKMRGLISVQSHTYDMHQSPTLDKGPEVRENILPLEGESEAHYIAALKADHQKMVDLLKESGADPTVAVAYPHGKTNALAAKTLKELGVKVTFTTDWTRRNTVIAGKPESLIDLGRSDVSAATTEEQISDYLRK